MAWRTDAGEVLAGSAAAKEIPVKRERRAACVRKLVEIFILLSRCSCCIGKSKN